MKTNIVHGLLQYFKDATMRKKLLLSYFILIFIPLGLLTYVSYTNVSRVYENQIRYSSGQSFDQTYTFLSYKINTLINTSDVVYFNTDVQDILARSRESYENDIIQQNIDMLNLDKFLNNFQNTEDVYRVCLYVPGWLMYSNQDMNFSNIDTFKTTTDYKKLMLSKNKVFWLPPQTIKNTNSGQDPVPVISLLRKIKNNDKLSEYIGIVKISILESNIRNIISKASTTRNGVVYLQNSEGTVISCSDTDNLKKLELNENFSKKLGEKKLSWEPMVIGKNQYAITARAVENTDWTMVTAIPYSEILAQSNAIRNLMLFLMLILGVAAYGAAYIISTSTTRRIVHLMKKMESVRKGELDVHILPQSKDEIGKLMNSFNYMIEKIRTLVEEQYKNGKEIKNAELKALQAQINPHFLYNTLDLINWKAIDNDVPEIAEIAQSLAKFYKLSLNKGRDIVTIGDEINHVKNYVQIQNYRFDNRINLILDVDEDVLQCSILKIILQPIVENSILHGILENRTRQEGRIEITGKLEGDTVLLTVKDDGIGMPGSKAQEILEDNNTPIEQHGYGVRNINNRIKLFYGSQYGLSYFSEPGNGTLVEIRIPAAKGM